MKKSLLCFCLSLVLFPALAQNLSGFWKGTLTMSGGCFPINHIELQFKITGTEVRGDSYHYLDVNNYVKKSMTGRYYPAEKRIVLQEETVTTFRIRPECSVCIKRYELYYSKSGKVETLAGGWTGHIWKSSALCADGNIVLSRIKESAFKEIPEIAVDTGVLKLDFYDNSQVDGDSITVKVNGVTVLSHQRLTSKAVTARFRIDAENPFQEVEMIAENLGSIPPNTAMLIVTSGNQRYKLFLSSTEEKSAKVRFIYDVGRYKPIESPPAAR